MKKIIILSLSLFLLAAACNKTATNNSNDNNNNQVTSPTPTPTPIPSPSPTPEAQNGIVEIDFTSSGVSPSNITIKKGTTVTFNNQTLSPIWPASAPHPSHTDLPGFDAKKAIGPGAAYSFTFDKVGTWGFHDHLNAGKYFGKITVTE